MVKCDHFDDILELANGSHKLSFDINIITNLFTHQK